MKKINLIILMMFMLLMAACNSNDADSSTENSSESQDGEAEYTFQVGHVVTTDHSYHLALEEFAENVYEKSDGRVEIEIFPSAQLGNERDLVEGLSMGSIDMALSNSGNIAAFTDAYQVFDMPFLFRDNEHAHAVLDSELGQEALDSLQEVNIAGLANWENGFFSTWNSSKPVEDPEDFEGLRIRANDNPIHIDSYEEMGASAVTMGWSEVYTAIQNGTVDGVSVSIPSMYTANIHEVAPYISTSSEFYVTVVLMMNKDLFDGLPEDLQNLISEEAVEVTQYQRELNKEIEEDALTDLEEQGFEITHPDQEKLREAVWDEIYDEYATQVGEDKINQILNDY